VVALTYIQANFGDEVDGLAKSQYGGMGTQSTAPTTLQHQSCYCGCAVQL